MTTLIFGRQLVLVLALAISSVAVSCQTQTPAQQPDSTKPVVPATQQTGQSGSATPLMLKDADTSSNAAQAQISTTSMPIPERNTKASPQMQQIAMQTIETQRLAMEMSKEGKKKEAYNLAIEGAKKLLDQKDGIHADILCNTAHQIATEMKDRALVEGAMRLHQQIQPHIRFTPGQ